MGQQLPDTSMIGVVRSCSDQRFVTDLYQAGSHTDNIRSITSLKDDGIFSQLSFS